MKFSALGNPIWGFLKNQKLPPPEIYSENSNILVYKRKTFAVEKTTRVGNLRKLQICITFSFCDIFIS